MPDNKTVDTHEQTFLRSMMDLLEKRDAVFPWEAAYALKIKTSEALQLLSRLTETGKAAKYTVESTVKECTGMGCIGCDCTNSYIKKEIKYQKID